MYNWSTNTKRLKKNPEEYTIWKLEQSINFGLGNNKLNKKELMIYFSQLNIDPEKKAYLNLILYDKKPTLFSSKKSL